MSVTVWTDKKINLLRAMWLRNSATEIAAVMGTTRNAVLGKAHRLDLQNKKPKPSAKLFRRKNLSLPQPLTIIQTERRARLVIKKPELTKNQLRSMLTEAVRNTAGMQA